MSSGGWLRPYADDVLVQEDTSSTTTSTLTGFWRWVAVATTAPSRPGRGAPFSTGRPDEASVYDRELSPEDVAVHRAARS